MGPDHVTQGIDALFAEAVRHHHAGRRAEAERCYRQVLAVDDQHADSLHLLGILADQSGRQGEAIELIGEAIRLRDDVPAYHGNLGNVLARLNRHADALSHFERRVALQPDQAEAHYDLGKAFIQVGSLAGAMKHFENAVTLKPGFAEAHNSLGNTLLARDNLLGAAVHYQRALSLKPGYVDAYNNLGNALLGLGELDLARQAYEKAVELAPKTGRYYRALVNTKRVAAGDNHLAAMEQLAAEMPSLPPAEQAELHFALGKAYADLGEQQRSFTHLLEGNAIKRREMVYDETKALNSLYRLRDIFTPDLMNTRKNLGACSELPIFIVGMARSGTTLMEQILASHPRVFGAGERHDFPDLALGVQSPDDPRSFPEVVPALSDEELRELGNKYLDAISPLAPEAERITDKMPGNFAFAGLIHLALPNARIIHMRRDPIDTCLSCFSILFTKGQPHTYDLAELGRYYRAYDALMAHWRQVLPEGVMLEIHYEDLVADVEQRSREVLAFCGLDWDDRCLAFHTTRRSIRTASAGQVRQPVYRTSIGRWRPYGALLRPLITELGLSGSPGGEEPADSPTDK